MPTEYELQLWREQDILDSAYGQGRTAWHTNMPRMSNPYSTANRKLQDEWWKDYDDARHQTMTQNLRAIGKKPGKSSTGGE